MRSAGDREEVHPSADPYATRAPRTSALPRLPPTLLLLGGALGCLLLSAVVILTAVDQPWLGLELSSDPEAGTVRVVGAEGPASGLPFPSILEGISAPGNDESLRPIAAVDLLDEPDFIIDYEEMDSFFRRQSALYSILDRPALRLHLRDAEGVRSEHLLELQTRPIRSLPAVFWFQLLVGIAGILIGLWVLVLSPGSWSARMFALLSVTFPASAISAAIYSSRELALDGTLFRVLSAVNHAGSTLFGAALIGLFLSHPKALVRPRHLGWAFAAAAAWWAADVWRVAPDQNWGAKVPLLLEMAVASCLAVVQWLRSRGDPRARSSLRWFGLSLLVGSGLFLILVIAANMIEGAPAISQGYAFGFFLLMDVGFALGLRRHSLLGLDEWAFRVLFWVLGALLLVAIDVALILVLRTNPAVSLTLALLLCGFLYLPLRNWLWSRTLAGRRIDETVLFQGVLRVSFGVSATERKQRWIELLRSLYEPMEIDESRDATLMAIRLEQQGITLSLPPVSSLPAVRISYPWQGRGLFGPRDLRLAKNLIELMEHAGSTREAFQRGVREERQRIARDLHDHLGARLLSGLYGDSLDEAREAIRHSISDMRSVVNELTGKEVPLQDALAQLRHETSQRAEAAGLQLDWPLAQLPPSLVVEDRTLRHLTAMLRELISNAIRHAGARRLGVETHLEDGLLRVQVRDDGKGLDDSLIGNGLNNLRHRTAGLGGTMRWFDAAPGSCFVLELPLADAGSTFMNAPEQESA